ncbi:MAG: pyridoxamine 5'-phosphate oxidase family protein [Eubacterium sp.]|nr:pyridoxamine 5'-phosphate oxidase family protein [Eubacterium sp.]
MEEFTEKVKQFFSEFGEGKPMVLSTTDNETVSSRMMSVIQMNGKFYFQTDITMRKCQQINANSHVALCIDNIQVEGICKNLGHPSENAEFSELFEKCYKGSYDTYSSLENERVYEVIPTYIERWIYKDKVPYIETYDLENEFYSFKEYIPL